MRHGHQQELIYMLDMLMPMSFALEDLNCLYVLNMS